MKAKRRLLKNSTVESIIFHLHHAIQFYDEKGEQNNAAVLDQIEKVLKELKSEKFI